MTAVTEAGVERDEHRKDGWCVMKNVFCYKWSDGLTSFTAKVALQDPQLPSQLAAISFYQANESLTLFLCCFTIVGTFTPRAILWSEHWASKQKIKLSRGFRIDTYMPVNQLPI